MTLIIVYAEHPSYPSRAVSRPIPFNPNTIDSEPIATIQHPQPNTKGCPSGQEGFCIATPKNESCSLACDSSCNPKCLEGSRPVVIGCETVCLMTAEVKKGRNACGKGFEYFCAQETSVRVPATRCECPTSATAQPIGDVSDINESDSCSDGESSSSNSSDESESNSDSESDFSTSASDSDYSDYSYSSSSSDETESDSDYSYSSDSTYESDYSSFTEESEYGSFSSDDSSSEDEHYRRPRRYHH